MIQRLHIPTETPKIMDGKDFNEEKGKPAGYSVSKG